MALLSAAELEPSALLPQELAGLTTQLDDNIHVFALGDKAIEDAALTAAKYLFDLAVRLESQSQSHISHLLEAMGPAYAPKTRSQAKVAIDSTKQSGPSTSDAILKPTPLTSLFVSGMDEEQVWAQLELKASNMCETLVDLFGPSIPAEAAGPEDSDTSNDSDESSGDAMEGLEDMYGMEVDLEDGTDEDGSEDSSNQDEFEDEEGLGGGDATVVEDVGSDGDDEEGNEYIMLHQDDDSDDAEAEGPPNAISNRGGSKLPKQPQGRHSELDDTFFNLTEFNAEIEEAESRRVTRGQLSSSLNDNDEDEEDEVDEVDFFAAVDRSEAFEEEDVEDTNADLYYKDFFKPPRGSAWASKREEPAHCKTTSKVRFNDEVRVKKFSERVKSPRLSSLMTSAGENDEDWDGALDNDLDLDDSFAMEDVDDDDSEVDGIHSSREAIERLKDDLFADDDEPHSDLTTFQSRQAKIKEQIAQLEAENVAKKDWTLMGEVSSKVRPQNSLLEEDLEFERVMKAVPIVTDETVQNLESRIKERILTGNFDDVVRRKPIDDKPFLPSRLFELQDKKSSQSLAQIYEDDFVVAQSGGATGEDRDGKMQKEHAEIEKQWESICYKLDALCNAHFTPKQPKATITTVSNVSTITMESALPTAKSSSTVLAPEEVFAVKQKDLRSRSELTPAERQALHAKEKKHRKKQRQMIDIGVDKFAKMNGMKGIKKQKEAALKSVVKAGKGVTVIGKKSQALKRERGVKRS